MISQYLKIGILYILLIHMIEFPSVYIKCIMKFFLRCWKVFGNSQVLKHKDSKISLFFSFSLKNHGERDGLIFFLSNTSYEKCYTQYVHSPLFHTYGCHKVFYLSWLLFILLFIILQCHTVVLLLDIHIALNAKLDGNIVITKTLIISENGSLYLFAHFH